MTSFATITAALCTALCLSTSTSRADSCEAKARERTYGPAAVNLQLNASTMRDVDAWMVKELKLHRLKSEPKRKNASLQVQTLPGNKIRIQSPGLLFEGIQLNMLSYAGQLRTHGFEVFGDLGVGNVLIIENRAHMTILGAHLPDHSKLTAFGGIYGGAGSGASLRNTEIEVGPESGFQLEWPSHHLQFSASGGPSMLLGTSGPLGKVIPNGPLGAGGNFFTRLQGEF